MNLAITLIFVDVAGALLNLLTCLQRQSLLPNQSPPRSKRRPSRAQLVPGVKSVKTIQASGVCSCFASFTVRASAHLRCAEIKKIDARLNFVKSS